VDEGEAPGGGIRWVDVDVLAPQLDGASAEAADLLLEAVGPHCGDDLEREMVLDLLDVADQREGERYSEGRIRSLSSFRASSERRTEERDGETLGVGGVLTLEPVELLAGDGWLISAWHTKRAFYGPDVESDSEPAGRREGEAEAVAERWSAGRGRTAGDLAVLLLHELALSYAPGYRAIRGWLEEWELSLYMQDEIEREILVEHRERLQRLWASMAELREWVNPLNRPGLRDDPAKAWFADATDHDAVIRVDDRVDGALRGLRDVGDMLRSSFGVLHVQMLEEQRDRREALQRRIEIGAAAFLVPTLIVGFYGANTRVPGGGTWWGFWVMVAALILLSAAAVAAVWLTQQRR
jgi:hypothetical protein